MINFLEGFGAEDHIYTVNGVRYVAGSSYTPINFKNLKQNTGIHDRIEHYLTGDFAQLPISDFNGSIDDEYVHLAAGKEENNAAKN